MSGQDAFGSVYTPQEIEEMMKGIRRRLVGLVKIAEDMDYDDPDRFADAVWIMGTVTDVTAWFDMQDAAIRRGSFPASRSS